MFEANLGYKVKSCLKKIRIKRKPLKCVTMRVLIFVLANQMTSQLFHCSQSHNLKIRDQETRFLILPLPVTF
jgi:hypothetical protein